MDCSSFREKSINITNNNCFSSRRLPKEITVIEDYGRSNVGIAFTWESQPGTPKVKYYDRPLPPITPPPSFIYSSKTKSNKPLRNHSKTNTLASFLPKFILRRTSRTPPLPVSSFSSSSSRSSYHSVPDSPFTHSHRRGKAAKLSKRWAFDEDRCESPVSTLCFGVRSNLRGRQHRGTTKTMMVLLGELA